MSPTAIEGLLADAFSHVTRLRLSGRRGTRWLLLGPGGGPRIDLELDGSRAMLQMNAAHARHHCALAALAEQSAWPGNVKHVVSAGRPFLRADVPLLMDTAGGRAWVRRQLLRSSEGMLMASGQELHEEAPPRDVSSESDPELLAQACAACGWSTAVKPDGAVRIDLQLRSASRTVMLHAEATGIRASVAIATGALVRASAPCRAATGILLMRASSALRWARSFIKRENGAFESAGFECCIAAQPDEQALIMAVDVLSTACELFGREAEVLLEHRVIATRYCEHMHGIRQEAPDDSSSTGAASPRAPATAPAAHAVRA